MATDEARGNSKLSDRMAIGALLWTVYSGDLKGTPLLSWLPIDATLLGAAVLGLIVVKRLVGSHLRFPPGSAPTICLWLCFLPGVVVARADGVDSYKSLLLYTVTLMCAVAPSFIVHSTDQMMKWIRAQVWIAVAVAPALYLFPATETAGNVGRINLEGGTSIAIARILANGALICAFYALTARLTKRPLWWVASGALALAMALIGSRGPFVALIAAAVVLIAFAKIFARRRVIVVASAAVALVPFLWYVFSNGGTATSRLAAVLTGDSSDQSRALLYSTAANAISQHPEGLGWGGFSHLSEIASNFSGESIYPHDIVLEIGAEGGWIALAGFLLVTGIAGVRAWRESGTAIVALTMTLATFWGVSALFSSDINGNRMWWSSLSVMLVAGTAYRHSRHMPQGTESRVKT